MTPDWLAKVRGAVKPYTAAARHDSKRMILSAVLTAVITFSSAIILAIQTDPTQLTALSLVSAFLSGLVSFSQTVLATWKQEHHE
jgi:prepilin signal peptidase PulO-like enzyme (type II secretory pathway)